MIEVDKCHNDHEGKKDKCKKELGLKPEGRVGRSKKQPGQQLDREISGADLSAAKTASASKNHITEQGDVIKPLKRRLAMRAPRTGSDD